MNHFKIKCPQFFIWKFKAVIIECFYSMEPIFYFILSLLPLGRTVSQKVSTDINAVMVTEESNNGS